MDLRPGAEFSRNADLFEDDRDPLEPQVGSRPESQYTERDLENVNKTGTTTVAMTTPDSVVIGTDRRASVGGRLVSNKDVQKVSEVQPNAALTMSGSVGGAQSFLRYLRLETNLYEARRGEYMSISALSTMAGNLLRGGPFFLVAPLLGGVDDEGSQVYQLDPAGGVMADDYAVSGSGQQMALGVLEQEYDDDLTTEEARTVAARSIESAVERDTASGNGLYLAVVTEEAVDIQGEVTFDDLV